MADVFGDGAFGRFRMVPFLSGETPEPFAVRCHDAAEDLPVGQFRVGASRTVRPGRAGPQFHVLDGEVLAVDAESFHVFHWLFLRWFCLEFRHVVDGIELE